MSYTLEDIRKHPNSLAGHYSYFGVSDRLLLTGHSHQAWPDVAREAMTECFDDAAKDVDNKWEQAFIKAEEVRSGYAGIMDDHNGCIALGSSTHDLIVRFLSALPLKTKPRLVTTDGEFHTLRRQLMRLAEEGIEVVRVPSYPVEDIAGRIAGCLDNNTAAVMVSAVFFHNGLINPGISEIAAMCKKNGIELLVDAYHALNVVPFSVNELGLEMAFVTGGGYKYCQLGEGNCFLRFPRDFKGRPVITGWFSEFSLLSSNHGSRVEYGQGPDLFGGSTYDPVSHYRAARVFKFFSEQNLSPCLLRKISQHQIALLIETFLQLDLPKEIITIDTRVSHVQRAGFLVLTSSHASLFCGQLAKAGVLTDSRGNSLRFGPAPYLSDLQLRDSMAVLGDLVRQHIIAG